MMVDTPYIFPNKWNDLKIITEEKQLLFIFKNVEQIIPSTYCFYYF